MVPSPTAAAASDACEGSACAPLALYLVPGGPPGPLLSPLPGVALAGDPATLHRGGPFSASAIAPERPFVIAKQDAFRVVLDSPTTQEAHGWVEVRAATRTGAQHVLARAELAPMAPGTFGAERAALAAARDAARTVDDSSAATGLQTLRERACSARLACDALQGDAAVESFGPCRAEPDPRDGLMQWLVWYGVQAEERRAVHRPGGTPLGVPWPLPEVALGVPSEVPRACEDRSQMGDAEAAALDAASADVRALAPPLVGVFPPASDEPMGPSWTDFTLNATPPAWLAQDGGSFVLPAGMQLLLVGDLRSVNGTTAPVLFEYGRADALSRLEVRTSTWDAFPGLVPGAGLIMPGNHTATILPGQASVHQVDAPAGWAVRVVAGPGFAARLWSPTGVAYASAAASAATAQPEEGRWTLRIERIGSSTSAGFHVELLDPGREPAVQPLPEGTLENALGAGDDVDTYTFPAWSHQRFELRLDTAPENGYALDLQGGFIELERESGPGFELVRGRAYVPEREDLTVHVVRAYGSGAYALTLWLDDGGDLTQVPVLEPVLTTRSLFNMQSFGSGVDVIGGEGLLHVTDAGVERVGPPPFFMYTRDAEGRLVTGAAGDPRDTLQTWVLGSTATPVTGKIGAYHLTPDGGLLVAGDEVTRVERDRSAKSAPVPFFVWRGLVAVPDGGVLFGGVQLLDPVSLTFTPAPAPMLHAQAFDEVGHAYRVVGSIANLVERVDLATNATTVVARAPSTIHEMAFGGTGLYVIVEDHSGAQSRAILAKVDLGVPGYGGARPVFDPAPAPDLRVGDIDDEVLRAEVGLIAGDVTFAEVHRIRATVENLGPGNAGATWLHVRESCSLWCRGFFSTDLPIPALDAGESAIVEFEWRARERAGEKNLTLVADAYNSEAELDERNIAFHRASVLVHGVGDACRQQNAPAIVCDSLGV